MNVVVRIPAPLRPYAGGHAEVRVEARTVGDALAELTRRHPALRRHLYGDDGRLRGFVNVFVDSVDVRAGHGESTDLRGGETIIIVPSIAGGEDGGRSVAAPNELSRRELVRYSRHLILPGVGLEGQRRLKEGRVLVVGAGGLGSPVALYLAAAGVGTLGLVDFDAVDETNLQRQILYDTRDVGRPKLEAAVRRLQAVNPDVDVVAHAVRLTSENAFAVIEPYDMVVDGTDNFPTRYLVNDACVLTGKPFVYGSILRFEGQVTVFPAGGRPCYRCLFRQPPPPGLVPDCAEGGVLGVLPGIIGSLQALECIKLVLDIGEPLAGRFRIFDALAHEWREVRVPWNQDCPVCGENPTVTGLVDYDAFCGLAPGAPVSGGAATPEITATALRRRLDAGDDVVLLDVREPEEWRIANLEPHGARLLPLGRLADGMDALDPGAEIVVYCRSGPRSERALRQLRAAGFGNVAVLRGGILAWADDVDPSLPKY